MSKTKKIYNVRWQESFSVNVEAESEEKAEDMIMDNKYDEAQVNSEISSSPEAFEMKDYD